MATFYLLGGSSSYNSKQVTKGNSYTASNSRSVSGIITKVKFIFDCDGAALVSGSFAIDGVTKASTSAVRYDDGTNHEYVLNDENGWNFSVGSVTAATFNNNSTANDDVYVKRIEVTYTEGSSGGSGGGGSDEPDEPEDSGDSLVQGDVSYGLDSGEFYLGQTFNFNYSFYANGITINKVHLGLLEGTTITTSLVSSYSLAGGLTWTPESTGVYTVIVFAEGSDGKAYVPIGVASKTYTIKEKLQALGPIDTPTITTGTYVKKFSTGKYYILSANNYTIKWNAPVVNNNGINRYQLIRDDELYIDTNIAKTATSYTITNNLNTKGKATWKIQAVAAEGGTAYYSTSPNVTVYKLGITIPTSVTSSNPTLIEGSTKISWDKPTISVHSEASGLTVKYDLKYQTSSDKKTWSSLTTITGATNLTTNYYTIDDVSFIKKEGDFIRFKIACKIYYGSALIYTATTKDLDGFIKFVGYKPNQLASIIFKGVDLENKIYESICSKAEGKFEGNYNYITKGSSLIINFNDLVAGYSVPGVKITWDKTNGTSKSKEFFGSASSKTMTINLIKDEFFTDDFWNPNTALKLTITSLAKTSANIVVLEDTIGYFYSGESIQIASLPIMDSQYDSISVKDENIFVNFNENNLEPIVNNKIYEDVKIVNIKGSQAQNFKIYGYKVYATVNNKRILVTDKILNTSYTNAFESYENGLLIPKYEINMDGEITSINNIISLELNIHDNAKNSHLTSLLGTNIRDYVDRFEITYEVAAIDSFNQESINNFIYKFSYDCRKPSEFEIAPKIYGINNLQKTSINIYDNTFENIIPVFDGDSISIKFYPAIKFKDKINNPDNYFDFNGNSYLKNGATDPNYYHVYKFIKQSNGSLIPKKIGDIQPFLVNPSVIHEVEIFEDNKQALYYLYTLNLNLINKELDEIEYFQIIPWYEEEGYPDRISRIYCYTAMNDGILNDNLNKFNVIDNTNGGENSAIFWNTHFTLPKIQTTAIERIPVTQDEFGFTKPKLKFYINDWGITQQFVDDEKLTKEKLELLNRFTNLKYTLNYYKEKLNEDGKPEFDLETGEPIKENLNISWMREYLTNSQQIIDYDTLAKEYGYNDFSSLYAIMDEKYQENFKDINGQPIPGSTKLNIPTSGTTIYINLDPVIIDSKNNNLNFYAELIVEGTYNRLQENRGSTEYKNEPFSETFNVYISQNKQTFIIQQGKLGINQPKLREVEESLYIVDKKTSSTDKGSYPNILSIEADREYNKISGYEYNFENNKLELKERSGAFIGFYDDSIRNESQRILMGSIGYGVEFDGNGKATNYAPYIVYNKIDENGNLTLTSLDLIPEAGSGIEIKNHKISHTNNVNAVNTVSFLKIKYDSEGHITGNSSVNRNDIRKIARISYGNQNPSDSSFSYEYGTPAEGDIYLWIQNE